MNTLVVENLTKSFHKNVILNNIAVTCRTGDIIGVFGRNGAGKSTLLKCVFGTLHPDTIEIHINEKRVDCDCVIPDKKIGYLPQNSFLPKEKKVRDIIPLLHPDGEAQDKIFYAPNIHKIEKIRVGRLSLGELRYLELILLAYLDHQFLLLDEPFSMIQPLHKEWIKELLISLKEDKGIIITDHYYEDVLKVSSRNILIKNGKSFKIENKEDLQYHGYLKR